MDKEEKTKSVADELKNKQVKTYAEDMAKVIESDSGGLIKKIIHQQEQYEIERKNSSPRSKKNQLFIFTGIVLVFLAIVLLVSLGVFKNKTKTVELIPQYTPPIFIDQNFSKRIVITCNMSFSQRASFYLRHKFLIISGYQRYKFALNISCKF